MNIFLLSYSRDPAEHFAEQAAFHCDKHVIKMIAESVQLIVTGGILLYDEHSDVSIVDYAPRAFSNLPCKPLSSGHAKHPCTIWTKQAGCNIFYLARLAKALCQEKRKRWPCNPPHVYETWIEDLINEFREIGYSYEDPIPQNFPIAVNNLSLQSTGSPHGWAVTIYRHYYCTSKRDIATWHKTSEPRWYLEHEVTVQDYYDMRTQQRHTMVTNITGRSY